MNQRIANNLLRQKAVYWGTPVRDGFGGHTFADPVSVKCRWIWKQQKYVDQDHEEHLSQAIVIVNQDVEIGGRIALVDINDLNSSELPEGEDSFEIKAYQTTSDYKGKSFTRKVWL